MGGLRKNIVLGVLIISIYGCSTAGPLVKPDSNSRKIYVNSHPELNQEIKQSILNGEVIVGMTREQVRITWSEPSSISNSSNSKYYDEGKEGWYYKGSFMQVLAPNCTVTFKDGIVTSVYCGSWHEK